MITFWKDYKFLWMVTNKIRNICVLYFVCFTEIDFSARFTKESLGFLQDFCSDLFYQSYCLVRNSNNWNKNRFSESCLPNLHSFGFNNMHITYVDVRMSICKASGVSSSYNPAVILNFKTRLSISGKVQKAIVRNTLDKKTWQEDIEQW